MNIDDEQLDAAAGQVAGSAKKADPLDAAATQVVQAQRTQLRSSLYSSLLANPDVASRANVLARKTGLPADVVERNLPDVQRNTQLDEYDTLLRTSPRLAAFLGLQQNAKAAHDDLPTLSRMESTIGAIRGPDANFWTVTKGLANSLVLGARMTREGMRMQFADLFGFEAMRQDAERRYGQASLEARVNRPEFQSETAQGIYGGGESIVRMAPGLAASILTRSPTPTLAAAGLQTEAEAYGKYRVRGATPGEAFTGAVGEGAVEAATEKLPMGFLVNKFGKAGAGEFLAGLLAREIPGEQVATLVQDAIDTAVANPDKTWQQYLEERPGAAYQTLVATVTQSAILGGASTLAERSARRTQAAQQAEQNAQVLLAMSETAAASKLRARDPAHFEQFVKQAAEDGPVQDVYISASTLAQSGVDPNALAAVSPSVAAQFNDALATGGDIRIPVEEFAARIAGTDFSQSLIPHLKTDPLGLTQAEAQTYMQNQAAELQADVERTLAEKQGDDTFKASRDAVSAQMLEQLNAAGRFTPDVNRAYADMIGNFYAVQGAKIGLTPEQMAAKYPLQVRAERLAGAKTLDQPGGLNDVRKAWDDAGIKNFISERNGDIYVAQIVVPEDERSAGKGTAAMQQLIEYADRTGQRVVLTPSSDFGGNKKRLVEFYKRFGFVENKGRGKDFTTMEGMYRPPKAKFDQGTSPRGSITLGDDITQTPSVITLLQRADLSTFLHESGHFYLEVLADMASRPDAPQSVQDDMAAVLKWFGVPDLATWNAMDIEQKRDSHEQFARGFEAYLFEGKAPSVELAGLFQRFRAWLLNVYRSLTQLNVELNDEVRGVFDRMLASNDAIKEAEAVRGYGGLFATKPEFMSDDEWLRYQALGQDATQSAIHDLESRSLRDMKWLTNAKSRKVRELQREADSKRKAVRAEVEAEVMAEPVNKARRFLRTGEMTAEDGSEVKAEKGFRLNTDALREMYPESALNSPDMAGLRGMTSKEGLHPDLVADMFGFTSGDHLVRELLNAEKAAEKIDGITDQRMLERYGDLTDPQSIERAADAALHDDARTRFVATELAALEKATNPREDAGTDVRGRRRTVATLPRAAKAFAEATIARLKVRDIKPGQYSAAAARAAKNADAAFKKGDIQGAAVEKRNQLVNSYADRAAHDAQAEVEKALGYFKKFDSDGTRKSLDAEYLDQIDALLARFDLRSGQSLRAIDKRKSLLAWAESQREQGFEPDIPEALLDEAARKSYKDMTVEELRGLRDTVKQIEHLARLKHKLLTAKDQREYETIRDEIAASIVEHAGDRVADTRTPTTNLGRVAQGLRRFFAAHVKAATWARVLDGGKDGGPMWEYFIRSANERGDQETTMRAEATEKLSAILAPVFKLGKMGGKGQFFPSVGRSLNREARLAVALNVGNESNLQRLLGGEGWTLAQVQPVLDSLTKQEWDAVQAIWDHFEQYRPLIEAKERRVYGKAPAWLEPTPVATPHGEYRGGYYPVKYDPAASQRAEEHADAEGAKRQLQGAYTSATTRRSFTKARAEEVHGRPLLYSLAGLYSGVNDVIHDLSWHEWLIDANRLLRSQSIDAAIRNHYGPEAKQQFKEWAAAVAEGDAGASTALEVAIGKLRQNISVAGLGFNVMSAALQGLGLTQSIVRVGPTHIARGITQFIASPIDSTRMVNEKSEFMRNRSRTRFRELNELRNRVQADVPAMDVLKQNAFVLMMRCQQMVDIPTWLGAYDKAIGEGNDEARAAALADQAVIDAQGGGQNKDLAAIERGGPFAKLFTTFYTFMNTAFNLGVAETMTESSKARLAVKYLMLYSVPPALGVLLKAALTPGDEDDEELAKKLAASQISYLMGMMVVVREFGEAANIVTGQRANSYAGPAGVRIVGDTFKFGQQAAQGEFDDAFRKAAVNLAGDALGLPAAQINRTITGTKALAEGKTSNPAAVAFGFEEKR